MVSSVMTGGIERVTPINTKWSLTCKFSVHQDKKHMLTSQSISREQQKDFGNPIQIILRTADTDT